MATAWHMPGMLSPCWALVADISAPVAANSTRFHMPLRIDGRMCAASTEALHPQPEPPACTSCAPDVVYQHPAVEVHHTQLHAVLAEQRLKDIMPHRAEVTGEYRVVVKRVAAGVLKMLLERTVRRRSHRGAHVVGVGYTGVCYGSRS